MKSKFCYILALIILCVCFVACTANDSAELNPQESTVDTAPENTDATVPTDPEKHISYSQASEKYATLLEQGNSHQEHLTAISKDTETLMQEISTVHADIVSALEQIYSDSIANAQPALTHEEFEEQYVKVFEAYYQNLLEQCADDSAYAAISNALCYGGTAASDGALLWKYTHTYNVLAELHELKDFISK